MNAYFDQLVHDFVGACVGVASLAAMFLVLFVGCT